MKYEVKFTTQFKKDLKLAKKQNKNLDKLLEVIHLLSNGEKLETKYKDHALSGIYKGTRECHIEPDWLLVYELINDVLVLMLYRLGSHSALFKKQEKLAWFAEYDVHPVVRIHTSGAIRVTKRALEKGRNAANE